MTWWWQRAQGEGFPNTRSREPRRRTAAEKSVNQMLFGVILSSLRCPTERNDAGELCNIMADRSRSPSPAPSSHRSFLAGQNDVVRTGSSDSTTITIRLYLSHFLSTWNSRMFEFAAFLFLAAVFPGTLLFASIYALARSCAVFLLSSSIGSLMDRTNRLVTIRHSIGEPCLDIFGS